MTMILVIAILMIMMMMMKGDNSAGDYGSDNGHANGNDKNKW